MKIRLKKGLDQVNVLLCLYKLLISKHFRAFALISVCVLFIPLGIANGNVAHKSNKSDSPDLEIIKEIRFEGVHHTDLEMLERELLSKVGQPFRTENLAQDRQRLDRLNIFSEIDFKILNQKDGVILTVVLRETFLHLPIPAIEVSEENDLTIGGGYKTQNLFGRAVGISSKVMFGGSTVLGAEVINPWFASGSTHYRFKTEYRERTNQVYEFDEKSLEIIVEVGRQISEEFRLGGRGGVFSLASDLNGITVSGSNQDNLFNAGFFIGYDTRDLWSNPSSGWRNEVELSRWDDKGPAGFWSFLFDLRRYLPIADRHTVGLFSLTTLRTGKSGIEVPIHQDFLIGGVNTVRGWPLASKRGINQFLNTAEYRYTIMRPRALQFKGLNFRFGLQVAGFADWGFAWKRPEEFKLDNSIAGIGFGFRLLIPYVESIRIDFAYGERGGGMKFYLGIFEKADSQRNRVR
jgi:outer membrane protein assembly factor BamA